MNTKGLALPSIIGTSGPSNSTIALSIPIPASAESKCSTVEIFISLLDRLVDSLVSNTFYKDAFIGADSISILLKTIPELLGAGFKVKDIFLPVWRPTPEALILLDNVLCLSISYVKFYMNILYFQVFMEVLYLFIVIQY